jgi:hypothetical protein
MYPRRHILLAALLILVGGLWPGAAEAQTRGDGAGRATFTQVTRPVARLTSQAAINRLMNKLLITPRIPRDSVSRIEVIDVTENGYGPDDLIVVYPSGGTFPIRPNMVTDEVQKIMNTWQLRSEFQYDGVTLPADTLRPDTSQVTAAQADTVRDDTTRAEANRSGGVERKPAQYSITADLLEAIQRNYSGDSLNVLLEKTGEGLTVEMWGYDKQAMQFEPPPTGPPDTVRVRDPVYIVRSDSTVYDVVYIQKTVEKTEYVPEGPLSSAPAGQPRETSPDADSDPRR